MKRLRIVHVLVQPVLVWDENDELSPGPSIEAQALSVSGLRDLPDKLVEQVAKLGEATSASV